MLSTTRSRTRFLEINGHPTSVVVRASNSLSKNTDDVFLRRRKPDVAQDKILQFSKDQSSCDLRMKWERSTQRRIVSATINRRLQEALEHYQRNIDERRERLRHLLESEDHALFKEMETKKETLEERQNKMSDRAKSLKERRENERQRVVADKYDQLFREQCEELRALQIKRRQDEVCTERQSQIRTKEEVLRMQEEEDRLFVEMWERDRLAKEERYNQELQCQRTNNIEQSDFLQTQMEMVEQQRIHAKRLKEEEAALLRAHREMLRLESEREHRQKLQNQEKRRKQLDTSLRLKMKRLIRDHQEELALDMSILQQLMAQERDEKQEEAIKKVELQEEQRRYREYLSQQLEEQKRQEVETEQLFESELQQAMGRREAQWRLEKTARDRLMKDVMETRSLQIQEKLNQNIQKQADSLKEKEDLERTIQENKLLDDEEMTRLKEATQEYQADLLAQMLHRQQMLEADQAEKEYEFQRGQLYQEEYKKKMEEILARPESSSTVHPFRRRERPFSSSEGQMA